MIDATQLRGALDLLYEQSLDQYGRNTTPVRWPLDVVGDAARTIALPILEGAFETVKCSVCDGHGWYEDDEGAKGCSSCQGRGWVGEAWWLCKLNTDRTVCNPEREAQGHIGCGWAVALAALIPEDSE